jgi:hypothetical protein
MYGYVTSKDVETYNETVVGFESKDLITVEKIYTYGTDNLEINSDCALSDDNLNLMVVFSTNYHKTIAGLSRIWISPTSSTDGVVGAGKFLSPSYNYWSNSNPFTLLTPSCGTSTHQWNYGDSYASMSTMLTI